MRITGRIVVHGRAAGVPAGCQEATLLSCVGLGCGFSDRAHFTREFRGRVNMTPGAYRNLRRAVLRPPPMTEGREACPHSEPGRERSLPAPG